MSEESEYVLVPREATDAIMIAGARNFYDAQGYDPHLLEAQLTPTGVFELWSHLILTAEKEAQK